MTAALPPNTASDEAIDSPYAWFRLGLTLLIMTLGNGGMWVVPVIIPAVQAEFGIGRAESALP